jgi:hypothetical protein
LGIMIFRMDAHPTSGAPSRLARSTRARKIVTTLLVACSLWVGCRTGEMVSNCQALDDGRQWLDPRKVPTRKAPVLLRAAAANARNQTTVSERLLLDIVGTEPASESARHAYELLSRIANLVFYENKMLLAVTILDTRAFLALDTGAETTDLNANFARQFKRQTERAGTKGRTSVAGAGGTAVIESLTLPEVTFSIGGSLVALRPAHVTLQENPALGGRCCVGNIGLDLLLQTGAVTIDFRTMTVSLR